VRIGIDARKIADTGIGRYIENLVARMPVVDDRHEYVLFMAPVDIDRYRFADARVAVVPESAKKYGVREHFALGAKARAHKVDLFHAPHYVLPLTVAAPCVTTIHDVIHLQDPTVGPVARRYARFMIGQALRKSREILTVSEASKRAILEQFPKTDPEKIVVTLNGAGDLVRPPLDQIAVRLRALRLIPGYVLYVGSDRPHKNLAAVERVARRLAGRLRFVVVGRVADRSRFAGLEADVAFMGEMSKDDLAALYAGAIGLLFPSYLEGFGLPPLEAMACGAPVVAADRSAIPEVVGDAAVLVDPDDHETMARTLVRLDEDLVFRQQLISKGFDRVKEFSWDRTARQTLAVYDRVAASCA
jgi:alpha-1,3-rhamnosyl/mannosyltransferase